MGKAGHDAMHSDSINIIFSVALNQNFDYNNETNQN